MTAKKPHHYDASDIQVLEGLDPVRKRPGMYIGTTGPEGLHHLVWEVFDNSRDEAMGGFADDIEIVLLPGNVVRVADNGRGIPVDMHSKTKVSALETIMTTLHAGGKFGGGGYKVSGGLHGVGVSVVNALSAYTKAEVHRDGGKHMQEYIRGVRKAAVKKLSASKENGTIISFEPDTEIFSEVNLNYQKIVDHVRQQAYLVKKLRISVFDAREYEGDINLDSVFWFRALQLEVSSMTFYFEGGLRSLVQFYNHTQKPIHKNIFHAEKEQDGVEVEIALQYVDDISDRIIGFANNTYNPEGGTHITGFKTALTRSLNTYGRKNNLIKEKEENFTGDDVLEGLTVVVSVKLEEIQFEGQTKAKLGSMEARGAVETVFSEAFNEFLEEHPDDAKSIIQKSILALKARKAAKAAKDSVLRKGALEGMTLPGKLSDCQTKSAEEAEIFIVEGDSAGGCFSGDTEVALTDGRNISFRKLVEERKKGTQHYCYTIQNDGNIGVAPILHPRITKKNAKVITLTLDTGDTITCTPDHRFMLRDGVYKEAQHLTPEDSLMPLRRKHSEIGGRITIAGYEMVYAPNTNRWLFTHRLADKYNLESGVYTETQGAHVHHADFKKHNNNPDNLVRLEKDEHLALHRAHIAKTLHTPEAKEKARQAHKKESYQKKIKEIMSTPEMVALLSERAKKQWENAAYKQYMKEKYLEFYYGNAEYREEVLDRLYNAQKEYWSNPDNREAQAERVAHFFATHPEERLLRRVQAEEQWEDKMLREWRSEKTKEQWTAAFRAQRSESYNQTYLRKALHALHEIYRECGEVDLGRYNLYRKETNDKSLLKATTIADRFFEGDVEALKEAVKNYNHRIRTKKEEHTRIDVYDIEVPQTHNFALASGVFVHNSAKQGRDRRTQAILPMWGKVLNVERARLDKIVTARGVKELIIALGAAIGDTFDITKLRYHKIIIATDADVDGAHIRTLFLTLFYRYFPDIIAAGYLYIAQPPLYKIQQGKDVRFAYTEAEKLVVLKELGVDPSALEETDEVDEEEGGEKNESSEAEGEGAGVADKKPKKQKISLQRYKGLGEMNYQELWETTMDPARRILKQVTIEDGREADRIFDILMGTDVASRKSFIQSNAKNATIDI